MAPSSAAASSFDTAGAENPMEQPCEKLCDNKKQQETKSKIKKKDKKDKKKRKADFHDKAEEDSKKRAKFGSKDDKDDRICETEKEKKDKKKKDKKKDKEKKKKTKGKDEPLLLDSQTTVTTRKTITTITKTTMEETTTTKQQVQLSTAPTSKNLTQDDADSTANGASGATSSAIIKERPIVESSAVLKDPVADAPAADSVAPIADSDAQDIPSSSSLSSSSVTLLLFYQYVEPPWTNEEYKLALTEVERLGNLADLTGRMRVAKEGLNCTLTGSRQGILNFCRSLRRWKPESFLATEFKLTHHVHASQRFPSPLKIIPVQELVHYGLEGDKAPPIRLYHGTHLEPKDYHAKMAESNAVLIDVRNHYEAAIGRFVPPEGAAEWVDPKMRKSTEFPVWLDKPETLEKLQDKQVLMYCTGGIRCERASALLKYKMEHDPKVRNLNIQGVYQLQGGIDKYFKEFPEGGFWKGKNYTFDRRCAHAPPAHELPPHEAAAATTTAKEEETCAGEPPSKKRSRENSIGSDRDHSSSSPGRVPTAAATTMGKCEGCGKAWDKYRGKRRCPTCGVPSLTCRECWKADQDGTKKLDRSVRCDLCVEQGIWSKHDLRQREEQELKAYETRMKQLNLLHPAATATTTDPEEDRGKRTQNEKQQNWVDDEENVHATSPTKKRKTNDSSSGVEIVPNPDGVTRLYLRNMCRKNMNEQVLLEQFPDITHIVWRLVYGQKQGGGNNKDDKNKNTNGTFLGQAWVEFASPEAAARAVAQSGQIQLLGRPLYLSFQPPNEKDDWPPPHSAVHLE
ncbi:hypothetical protein ACA910_016376 [Epithemia clementina (nom. ined.)]